MILCYLTECYHYIFGQTQLRRQLLADFQCKGGLLQPDVGNLTITFSSLKVGDLSCCVQVGAGAGAQNAPNYARVQCL